MRFGQMRAWPEGWASKGGAPKGGPRRVGAQNFALFLPFPATVSLFLCLSGCLLVEFWWCLKRRDPLMCTGSGPSPAFGRRCSTWRPVETRKADISRAKAGDAFLFLFLFFFFIFLSFFILTFGMVKGASQNWPKLHLAWVELGLSRKSQWPKSKLAWVERAHYMRGRRMSKERRHWNSMNLYEKLWLQVMERSYQEACDVGNELMKEYVQYNSRERIERHLWSDVSVI